MARSFPFPRYDELFDPESDPRPDFRAEIRKLIGVGQLHDALDECAGFCCDVESFEPWIVATELFERVGRHREAARSRAIVEQLLSSVGSPIRGMVVQNVLEYYGLRAGIESLP